MSNFITQKEEEYSCPRCGSLSRTRRLWDLVEKNYLIKDHIILDFSPSRAIYRKFKKINSIQYTGTDLSGDFLADKNYDITSIATKDNSFDLILCYHILEHIENDRKAINELHRVLKPGGTCLIQTPFKEGETYEDYNIKSEAERTIHFGQKDHVRIYAALDLKRRLEPLFEVEIKEYKTNEIGIHGFKKNETILICTKNIIPNPIQFHEH